MFRASHFKSQNVPTKQIPTTWFGPKILSAGCCLTKLRLARTMTRFLFQLCASGQIANLHSTRYGLKVYLPFPFTLNVWHAKEMHVWHTKNWENQRRFTESKALPDLQPLHVVDPIRWSGLSFRDWLVTRSVHDLMTLLARFGKPHHPDPKKTCQKKEWTLLTLKNSDFWEVPFLLVFF